MEKIYGICYNISCERRRERRMLRFEFILPFIYGGVTSISVIRMGLFNLEMNTITWGVYLVNLFMAYILYRIGRVIDKCLERLW